MSPDAQLILWTTYLAASLPSIPNNCGVRAAALRAAEQADFALELTLKKYQQLFPDSKDRE